MTTAFVTSPGLTNSIGKDDFVELARGTVTFSRRSQDDPDSLIRWDGSSWQGPLFLPPGGLASVRVGPDGQPVAVIARTPVDGPGQVLVFRWDGMAWTQLGDAIDVGTLAMDYPDVGKSDLSIDAAGHLWLAVRRQTDVVVLRWVGVWEQLGDPISLGGDGLTLRIEPTGVPVVAGHLYQRGNDCPTYESLLVYAWSAKGWQQLGNDFAPSKYDQMNTGCPYRMLNGFSLALTRDGAPMIAWVDNAFPELPNPPTGRLSLAKWDGTQWQSIGTVTSSDALGAPSLAVDGNDVPVFAWTDALTAHVERWTDAGPIELGTMTSPNGSGIRANVLGFSGDTAAPIVEVAFGPEELHVVAPRDN